ncbi:MAG TPA: hypothetical protein ENF52_01310 [Chloroflexi bacterium]|nr:hypothetical protein [Chloroflexota bacterium]
MNITDTGKGAEKMVAVVRWIARASSGVAAALILLAIEIASSGLAAERPPVWTCLSTQMDSQL